MKLLTLFTLLSLASRVHGQECPNISAELSKIIDDFVVESRAAEYCQGRSSISRQNAEIVLFGFEDACFDEKDIPAGSCGNAFFQYLVAINKGRILRPFRVGVRGDFAVHKMKFLDENKIELTGSAYAVTDAACCPSLKESKTIVFLKGGFVWVNP